MTITTQNRLCGFGSGRDFSYAEDYFQVHECMSPSERDVLIRVASDPSGTRVLMWNDNHESDTYAVLLTPPDWIDKAARRWVVLGGYAGLSFGEYMRKMGSFAQST